MASNRFCREHCSIKFSEWTVVVCGDFIDISADDRCVWCGEHRFDCFDGLPERQGHLGPVCQWAGTRLASSPSMSIVRWTGPLISPSAFSQDCHTAAPVAVCLGVFSKECRDFFIAFNAKRFLMAVRSYANLHQPADAHIERP